MKRGEMGKIRPILPYYHPYPDPAPFSIYKKPSLPQVYVTSFYPTNNTR